MNRPKLSNPIVAPWKKLEIIVKHIEQAIGRDCKVTHDEWFQDKRTHDKRKFDVVIRVTQPHRTLVLVVEVQKRKKKVDFPTLDQWISKTRHVGVHGLICVSEKGYWDSAVRLAKETGDFVKLYQISSVDAWPSELPKIEAQIAIPKWHIEKFQLVGGMPGPDELRGSVVSGQMALEKAAVLIGGQFQVTMETLRDMIGYNLAIRLRSTFTDNTTVDIAFVNLVELHGQFLANEGMVQATWLGWRMKCVAKRFNASTKNILQYTDVLTGRAEGYYFTSEAETDEGVLTGVDIAIAPPRGEHLTQIVLPSLDNPPHVGGEFCLGFPITSGVRMVFEVKVHREEPPIFEVPEPPIRGLTSS